MGRRTTRPKGGLPPRLIPCHTRSLHRRRFPSLPGKAAHIMRVPLPCARGTCQRADARLGSRYLHHPQHVPFGSRRRHVHPAPRLPVCAALQPASCPHRTVCGTAPPAAGWPPCARPLATAAILPLGLARRVSALRLRRPFPNPPHARARHSQNITHVWSTQARPATNFRRPTGRRLPILILRGCWRLGLRSTRARAFTTLLQS